MSRVKCKKENYVSDLIDGLRSIFAFGKENDEMLSRINERLKNKYGFCERVL